MNIIIVGCGKVGATLAEHLDQEGHNVVVVDNKASVIDNVTNFLDVMGVVGSGASYSVLVDAGIEKADLLIAVTGSDELNLLCCLVAQKAGRCHTIARVRNPLYNEEIDFIKEEMGLSMTINPELEAATEMAALINLPSAIEIDTFAKGNVELLRFQIPENSVLNNMKIMNILTDLHSKSSGLHSERDEEFSFLRQFELRSNDIIQ